VVSAVGAGCAIAIARAGVGAHAGIDRPRLFIASEYPTAGGVFTVSAALRKGTPTTIGGTDGTAREGVAESVGAVVGHVGIARAAQSDAATRGPGGTEVRRAVTNAAARAFIVVVAEGNADATRAVTGTVGKRPASDVRASTAGGFVR